MCSENSAIGNQAALKRLHNSRPAELNTRTTVGNRIYFRLNKSTCLFYFRHHKFRRAVVTLIRTARGCSVRTLWSAAACCRFSVVKSALQQCIRSPGTSQEKQLCFNGCVDL